jgi:hypothetical protein
VESGEDVFRFHLRPEDNSDLPKITSSVLKTRGTLSMNKVYRYLIRKLVAEKAIDNVGDDQQADLIIEISCNGVLLNTFIQLKEVREKYWLEKPADELLELRYRKKNELEEHLKV